MFYLKTHSTHFIYSYMASDIWLRTIMIVKEETRYRHIGYSFWLAARVLLYAPSHRQDSTYHGLCYTSHGALAETRNSSMGPPHEGSIRRPIAPLAYALTTELHVAPLFMKYVACFCHFSFTLVWPHEWNTMTSLCSYDKEITVVKLKEDDDSVRIVTSPGKRDWFQELTQRCQPGTTNICKIMTKNPYNLQKNPYKLSTPLQNTILV